jgi:hypothetical protein
VSAKKDKKLRQTIRKYEDEFMKQCILDIQNSPFKVRFGFAWSILFPPKSNKRGKKKDGGSGIANGRA